MMESSKIDGAFGPTDGTEGSSTCVAVQVVEQESSRTMREIDEMR